MLERVGQATHARSEQYRLAGFTYREEIDAFECSDGALLPRVGQGSDARLAIYQAPERRCGGCALKHFCADSDKGRKVVRSSVPWIETEVARFHLGLSLTLMSLAALMLSGASAGLRATPRRPPGHQRLPGPYRRPGGEPDADAPRIRLAPRGSSLLDPGLHFDAPVTRRSRGAPPVSACAEVAGQYLAGPLLP